MTGERPGDARHGLARPLVHVAMGGFAFLLRDLTYLQAIVLAALALAFNRFVLPRVGGRRLYRQTDHLRGFAAGILLYPLAVLALILLFPSRPDVVAAAWAILAAGDGMASIVGSQVGGPRIPWNRGKTVAGSLAFVAFGSAAGVLLALWCQPAVQPPAYAWYPLVVPVLAAVAAAAAETVPIRLDDNVIVAATAAIVLWAGSYVSEDMLAAGVVAAREMAPAAVTANAVAAILAWRARAVSAGGGVAGVLIGVVIALATGWPGWLLLMATFAAATATSRIGLARKIRLGIAEARGGRRGAGNAIANTGLAAGAAFMAATTFAIDPARLAMVAALAAGGSDTVASEIGKAFGRRTFLITTLRGVPPGTPGAISLEGTMAGLLGAVGLGGLGAGLGLIPVGQVAAVVVGATVGSLVESALGATVEPSGLVNNDVLNLVNTGVAAGTAVWTAGWLS